MISLSNMRKLRLGRDLKHFFQYTTAVEGGELMFSNLPFKE